MNGAAAFWRAEAPALALLALVLTVLLLRARPYERSVFLNTLWLFLAGLAGLVAAYAFAWVGHFFFEKNRPATFTHPLYSFMGDWVMWRDILAGKIRF